MDNTKDENANVQRVDVALDPQEIGTLDEQKLKRKFEDALADGEDGSNVLNKRPRPGSRFDREKRNKVCTIVFAFRIRYLHRLFQFLQK